MRVLLIDDDLASLEVLHEVLVLNEYECVSHSNPADAMLEIENSKYDVVLTDYMMPKFTGLDILQKVKIIQPETRVIIYSAIEDDAVEEDAYTMGASAFFTKPIAWKEIEKAINNKVPAYPI